MRRVLGIVVLLLAGALEYAFTHPQWIPAITDPLSKLPHVDWIAGGAGVIGLLMLILPDSKPKFATIECPGCGKSLQKGRRNCPFCKTELVKY